MLINLVEQMQQLESIITSYKGQYNRKCNISHQRILVEIFIYILSNFKTN